MERAVVTGASGFIGGRLRDVLLERGVDVVAFRRPASPPAPQGRSVEVDYRDPDSVKQALEATGPAVVYHVAGATKGISLHDFQRANVQPTRALTEGLKALRAPTRLLHVSSVTAFGPSDPAAPHTESAEPAPVEHYGRSKLEAERVVEDSGVPFTVLRPGGVYGPGDVDYFKLFQLAAQGWNLFYGNRSKSFSKVYVDDFVDACLTAAAHPNTLNRSYFVCDGEPVTFEAFQAEIGRQAGRRVWEMDLPGFLTHWVAAGGELLSRMDGKPRLFNRQKAIMGQQSAWTCDPAEAMRAFEYRPRYDLVRGVAAAYAWYRERGWLPPPKQPVSVLEATGKEAMDDR